MHEHRLTAFALRCSIRATATEMVAIVRHHNLSANFSLSSCRTSVSSFQILIPPKRQLKTI